MGTMDIEVKAPGFPESVADGSVVAWHKQPGDLVKQDEILVDIETDKVMFEVPAVANGVLKKIVADVGSTVTSQEILAILDDSDQTIVSENKKDEAMVKNKEMVSNQAETAMVIADKSAIVAPSARNMIAQHELDVKKINGTGKGGRIMKEDVQRYMASLPKIADKSSVITSDNHAKVTQFVDDLMDVSRDKRVPMSRLRARVAERLVEAQHTAAILTTFNEVDMQPVMDLRQRYKDRFEKAHGVRLGYMSFFVKASVEALKRFPAVNASIDGKDIVYHNYFDIGIAVSSPRGLVVPIVRNAGALGLADIELQINNYAAKAKGGELALEEITGGTFTITNGGVFGSMLSTPILNPPQSAILGMHKIEQRPVVIDGEIVARPMMYLALSYDHRIIDGQEAVQFLVTIKDMLEDPARIILDI
jgi:2-oxoglutarate dehydrogenase E2 component (dihydrolipoamide succinyltransferase)